MANKILKEEIREKDRELKQLQEDKKESESIQDNTIDKDVSIYCLNLCLKYSLSRTF